MRIQFVLITIAATITGAVAVPVVWSEKYLNRATPPSASFAQSIGVKTPSIGNLPAAILPANAEVLTRASRSDVPIVITVEYNAADLAEETLLKLRLAGYSTSFQGGPDSTLILGEAANGAAFIFIQPDETSNDHTTLVLRIMEN